MLFQPHAFGCSRGMLGVILRCQQNSCGNAYPEARDNRPQKCFHAGPLMNFHWHGNTFFNSELRTNGKAEVRLIRFPLTVRLDDSDAQIFERAADSGEWAIPGSFVFSNLRTDDLTGKTKQAFASGFLGLASFGWSTLVSVGEMADSEYETLGNSLAMHFVARYGAPDIASALPAAMAELEFATGLCEHPLNSIIAVDRTLDEDRIRERFRLVAAPMPQSVS